LARLEAFHALAAREDSTFRREDARYANQIACGDTGRAKRELERCELFPVFADAFGEEHLLGNESDHVTLLDWNSSEPFFRVGAGLSMEQCMVNTRFPSVNQPRALPSISGRRPPWLIFPYSLARSARLGPLCSRSTNSTL